MSIDSEESRFGCGGRLRTMVVCETNSREAARPRKQPRSALPWARKILPYAILALIPAIIFFALLFYARSRG